MKCPQCGKEIKDGANFCPICGSKVEPCMKCAKCGATLKEGQESCVSCGNPVNKKENNMVREQDIDEPEIERKMGMSKFAYIFSGIVAIIVIGIGFFFWHEMKNLPGSETAQIPATQKGSQEKKDTSDSQQKEDTGNSQGSKTDQTDQIEKKKTEEEIVIKEDKTLQMEHTYQVFKSDAGWEEANRACIEKGGHLATITSEDEYNEIVAKVEKAGIKYAWIGGKINSSTDRWGDGSWITGEKWYFDKWYPGEPSYSDMDGEMEYYLCLWNAQYDKKDIGWTFNDQRNDIVATLPSISGKAGYVCEFEETGGTL